MLNTASFLVIVVVVVLSLTMTCLFHSYVFRWVLISFWVQFFCGFPIVKHVGPNCIATVLWINSFCSIFALFRSSTCQCINKWIVVGCMCLDWSEKIWFCFQSVNICEMKKKNRRIWHDFERWTAPWIFIFVMIKYSDIVFQKRPFSMDLSKQMCFEI